MVKNLLMLLDAGRSALTTEPRTVFHMDVEGNPAKGELGGEAMVRACHQMCVIKCAMQPGATLTYPSRPAFTAVGALPRERQICVVEPLRSAEEPCLVWDGKEHQLLEALLGPQKPTVLDQRKGWAQFLNPFGREVSKDFPFPRHTLAFATTIYDLKVFPHKAEEDTKLQ